jgi:hypothetical protein
LTSPDGSGTIFLYRRLVKRKEMNTEEVEKIIHNYLINNLRIRTYDMHTYNEVELLLGDNLISSIDIPKDND